MSGRWGSRIRHALLWVVAAVLLVTGAFETGLVDRWMRNTIIARIEQGTGARAEIGSFHFHLWQLRAEIGNLTLHGLEGPGDPPLFHADDVTVAARIISFFGGRVALNELIVYRPQVAVRIDEKGHSNLPTPKARAARKPWQGTLFQLQIGRLELRDGGLVFNNRRTPLSVEARNLEFALHYQAPANAQDVYAGSLQCRELQMTEHRGAPFKSDLSVKFTLHRDAFELDELVWKLPHSEIDLRADLASFEHPDWDLHYRGRLSLEDIRKIFRSPKTPDGIADFSGQAHYASNVTPGSDWTASGYYRGHDIHMPYKWFHAGGMETAGNYEVAKRQLVVPNLSVHAVGGALEGKLTTDFRGLAFRTETHLHGASLTAIFAALDNDEFPVHALHWDASVDVDAVNTWNANFKHFRTRGQMRWAPPAALSAGSIPATSHVDYDYSTDSEVVTAMESVITTPRASIEFDGPLGGKDSGLELRFKSDDLTDWDDFINTIRGPNADRERVAGKASWSGRILGPITGPTFIGHLSATDAQYGKLNWDAVNGDFEYSPDGFAMTKTVVERGRSSATLDLALKFDGDWSFLDTSSWTMNARMENASSGDLQDILGTSYPVTGMLTGNVRGSGTRAAPIIDADFVFSNIAAGAWRFDRLAGQFHWARDEIKLSRAELRGGAGIVAGDVAYRPGKQEVEFNLTGSDVSLEKLQAIQSEAMPVAGKLSFHLTGSGPPSAPVVNGEVRLADVSFAAESEGDFVARVASDGRNARITLASEPTPDKLQGELTIGLTGERPVTGRLTVKELDLDPLIISGLHLKRITGHSKADGVFTIFGTLQQPDLIEVNADISRISFDYAFVQLANEGDIHLTYRRNEVRIDQARLHGTDTDLQLSGTARFDKDRPLRLAVSGGGDLRLLTGFLPDIVAKGRADVNVSIEGTMSRPRVTGRGSVHDASMNYADFPTGLSKVNGDLVFDTTRLLFDRVTAASGGGQLTLSGNVTYGEGPLRYEVTATTSTLRIRYPAGMSWLAGGTLQMSGTSEAALVSGRVQVERLLFAQGADVASFFASSSVTSAGPPSTSAFPRNLAFDVEGQTSPGARIEWTGAHVDMDGDVRLRGTWDRPVLLGHIHLLGGEMPFRGNTFELTRGDINFSNPFRLDPVLNVEATSTINQYQVTIDFSGPASHLALNYRSDPPLPDSQIVALLALGSTGEESALRSQPGGTQNYGATALLSEAISTGIGGRIEHLFGISQFRVDPFVAGTATDPNAAARVTIQQRVARDLTITYSTNAATSNQYQMIQVEYAVKQNMSIVFLRDINGTYGFDVKFVKHFK